MKIVTLALSLLICGTAVAQEDTLNGRKVGTVFRKDLGLKGVRFMGCHKVVRTKEGALIEKQTCEEDCHGPVDGRKFIYASCVMI